MKAPVAKLSVSRLSLYNPSRLSDDEIVASFAARKAVFERMLADIAAEKPRSRPQHHLLVGQRGMGKSTLLARLAAELRTDEKLSEIYVPLVFAEEQYAVDRLSKFWLNCLDSLADACERSGDVEAMDRIDLAVKRVAPRHGASVAQDETPAAEALEAFLDEAKVLNRRPVLLVDNLQLVFERISAQQQHVLRELLMRQGAPIMVGASPSPPSESQDYGAAFYDHFKVHYLPALSVEEMRTLMLTLAERVARTDVRDRVLRHPHRLSVLRQLTGGNPRTTVTLFFLYAEDFAPSVFGDLENLLDRVTPLYKARFEELSAQQQVLASAIANHWDPVTARQLAEATGLAQSGIAPQLDRLEKIGFVERVELFGESSAGFMIAERFFNVWFLMRSASRRQRREVEFLTRFIESFYEAQDRSRLAQHLQTEHDFSADRHLFARALGCTLDPAEARDLRRHTELDALRQKEREARRKLEEVIDFSQLHPVTLAFDELREKLASLVPAAAGISPKDFATQVLGDRKMFQSGNRERLASQKKLSVEEVKSILESINTSSASDEEEYGERAATWMRQRLSSGQLAALNDLEEWNAAFMQVSGSDVAKILVTTLPPSIGCLLSVAQMTRIRRYLQPDENAPAFEWFNWGYDLSNVLGRFKEAEDAYREAIARNDKFAEPWNNLGHLLQYRLGRYEEAEAAYREAMARDDKAIPPWINLGNLLRYRLGRYEEAEVAYREAIGRDEKDAKVWDSLGNLLCDHLHRFAEASESFEKASHLGEFPETSLQNLVFLHRDFLGEGLMAQTRFDGVLGLPKIECLDTLELHKALFAAYAENWGVVCEALKQALAYVKSDFPRATSDDWFRASAVLLHLNYGHQLLKFLKDRGDDSRLRPWYEALAALEAGDRRYLQNLAPEVRTTAEYYFDQIERRLKGLPEKTRRRPLPKSTRERKGRQQGPARRR